MLERTQLTQEQIDALVNSGHRGRPKSPNAAVWEQLNVMTFTQGQSVVIPASVNIEFDGAFSYIRMRLSRFSQENECKFKTKMTLNGDLAIVCTEAPDINRIIAENIAEMRPKTAFVPIDPANPDVVNNIKRVPIEVPVYQAPAVLLATPDTNPEMPVEIKEVQLQLTAVELPEDAHPTKDELQSWLKQQGKGFNYIYTTGKNGSTPACFIEEWANELDNIAAHTAGDLVYMESLN